jgi:hypothetical protein
MRGRWCRHASSAFAREIAAGEGTAKDDLGVELEQEGSHWSDGHRGASR